MEELKDLIINDETGNDIIADVISRLYSLRPLEVMQMQGLYIIRIPGGWIFETPDADGNGWNPVFVPFNNEWQNGL